MDTKENSFRIRPRFKEKLNLPPEEIIRKIQKGLEDNRESWLGKIVDHHIIIKIPAKDQHYWSPQLTLELEGQNGETLIRGLFGPKPAVWTMFVFFYSSIGFLTLMGLIFGLSQMMLNMKAYGLWAFPIGSALISGLFLLSKIGQRLGRDQMQRLVDLLHRSLEMPIVDKSIESRISP
ncbi:MAG: hypothetical protein MI975_12065 [Cytophagales bacterium]|nr:hypothetical protein [Cytophagales bacterium]